MSLGIAITIIAANCATFTSYPDEFQIPSDPRPSAKPTASVSIAYSQKSILHGREVQMNGKTLEKVQAKYESFFKDSGYFTGTGSILGNSDLKVTVEAVDAGGGGGPVLAFISGLTLMILPAWAQDHFTVTFSFRDKKDKLLKQYVREVTFNTWIEILLLPVMPFKYLSSEVNAGFKTITYSVLQEADKDGILTTK